MLSGIIKLNVMFGVNLENELNLNNVLLNFKVDFVFKFDDLVEYKVY